MKETPTLKDVITSPYVIVGLVTAASLALSKFAFTREVRAKMLERDGYRCVESDGGGCMGGLEASHYDHKKEDQYNDIDNGRIQCTMHHLLYHLTHRSRARTIGLSENHNEYAIKMLKERVAYFVEESKNF